MALHVPLLVRCWLLELNAFLQNVNQAVSVLMGYMKILMAGVFRLRSVLVNMEAFHMEKVNRSKLNVKSALAEKANGNVFRNQDVPQHVIFMEKAISPLLMDSVLCLMATVNTF